MGGIVNNGAYANMVHVDKQVLNTRKTSQGQQVSGKESDATAYNENTDGKDK